MNQYFLYFLSFLIAYLLGSINTSIVVSRLLGTDIRSHGSGNAGATNTLRTLGKKAAIIVLIGDILKAIVAILIVKLFIQILNINVLEQKNILIYLAGFGAILGHNYPIFFGFRGGKGILTSLAVVSMIEPFYGLIILVVSIPIIAITKYVSLGSIVGALTFFVLVLIFNNNNAYYIIFSAMLAFLAVYRHKDNIKRLISGNETKISRKKE